MRLYTDDLDTVMWDRICCHYGGRLGQWMLFYQFKQMFNLRVIERYGRKINVEIR